MNAQQSVKVISTVLLAACLIGESPSLKNAPTLMGILLIIGTAIYVAIETKNDNQ